MEIKLGKHPFFEVPILWIPPGADLADVPSPYRELLRDQHREAFSDAAGYFRHLADLCALDGMKQWFAAIAKAGRCGLVVCAEALWRTDRSDILVCGWPHLPHSFRLQTPEGRAHASQLSVPLRLVYEWIDGTVDDNTWSVGIREVTDLLFDYIGSDLPIEEGTPLELLESPIFYNNGCGDHLVACDRKAWWYLHEIRGFREAGNLDEVISGYFHSQFDHRNWVTEPYSNM
jgi:hypothetical protein